jgi:hypothetical protein
MPPIIISLMAPFRSFFTAPVWKGETNFSLGNASLKVWIRGKAVRRQMTMVASVATMDTPLRNRNVSNLSGDAREESYATKVVGDCGMTATKANGTSFKKGHKKIKASGRKAAQPNHTTQDLKDEIMRCGRGSGLC